MKRLWLHRAIARLATTRSRETSLMSVCFSVELTAAKLAQPFPASTVASVRERELRTRRRLIWYSLHRSDSCSASTKRRTLPHHTWYTRGAQSVGSLSMLSRTEEWDVFSNGGSAIRTRTSCFFSSIIRYLWRRSRKRKGEKRSDAANAHCAAQRTSRETPPSARAGAHATSQCPLGLFYTCAKRDRFSLNFDLNFSSTFHQKVRRTQARRTKRRSVVAPRIGRTAEVAKCEPKSSQVTRERVCWCDGSICLVSHRAIARGRIMRGEAIVAKRTHPGCGALDISNTGMDLLV